MVPGERVSRERAARDALVNPYDDATADPTRRPGGAPLPRSTTARALLAGGAGVGIAVGVLVDDLVERVFPGAVPTATRASQVPEPGRPEPQPQVDHGPGSGLDPGAAAPGGDPRSGRLRPPGGPAAPGLPERSAPGPGPSLAPPPVRRPGPPMIVRTDRSRASAGDPERPDPVGRPAIDGAGAPAAVGDLALQGVPPAEPFPQPALGTSPSPR
jgi:hypothetical protein